MKLITPFVQGNFFSFLAYCRENYGHLSRVPLEQTDINSLLKHPHPRQHHLRVARRHIPLFVPRRGHRNRKGDASRITLP